MLENMWGEARGLIFSCLFVSSASSVARIRPAIETSRAANFDSGGRVIIGVFSGEMLEVIISPAVMLPQASRLTGLIRLGLFSLIGDSVLKRGWPMDTKKMIRML